MRNLNDVMGGTYQSPAVIGGSHLAGDECRGDVGGAHRIEQMVQLSDLGPGSQTSGNIRRTQGYILLLVLAISQGLSLYSKPVFSFGQICQSSLKSVHGNKLSITKKLRVYHVCISVTVNKLNS